jgi:hypothetical protein
MIGDILQHFFIGLRIKTPLNARFKTQQWDKSPIERIGDLSDDL